MITYEDVKFFKSEKVNFYDAENNGGIISDTEIVSGDLNNIFDETTATQRENGIIKRAKIYIKNLTSDRIMKNSYLAVSKDADYPDTVKLYYAPLKPTYSFTFTNDVTSGTSAGTHITYSDPTPDGVDVNEFVGRKFKVGNQLLTIDGVDADNNELWFNEDIAEDIAANDVATTADDEDTYENDVDWSNAKPYLNTPILRVLNTGDTYCMVSADDAANIAAGDPILIVDVYRRPMFRGYVKDIADGDTESTKKINFTSTYLADTIPANGGYLATALSHDIGPGEHFGFWLELSIGASNALAAEEVSSYQLEITFDDVAAS